MSGILKRGQDKLEALGDFSLVGRDQELQDISSILMRMLKRNLLVTGRPGVGVTSVILGLQAAKANLKIPVEVIAKKFFWLDTDALFESGQRQTVDKLFTSARQTLKSTAGAVVIIEDTIDFVRAVVSSGNRHLVNGLMGDLRNGAYQVILETSDNDLGEVLSIDSDILELFSLYEIQEPTPENLKLMLKHLGKQLEKHHGVRISKEAIETAASLTEKYKLESLRGQPDAGVTLLDRSLTDLLSQVQNSNTDTKATSPKDISDEIREAQKAWRESQDKIRSSYADINQGEAEIYKLEQRIAELIEEHQSRASELGTEAVSTGIDLEPSDRTDYRYFSDTDEIKTIRKNITKLQSLVDEASKNYNQIVRDIYKNLSLENGDILRSFSSLSGIPVDSLTEDDKKKLLDLEEALEKRVIGQPEPVQAVAKAIKRARLGLKLPNRPAGTFLFLGPSGVGKTELAKGLASLLNVSLLRFDMSEYMERHAVAKLIGAPPGYEGYEHGGILTNSVRKNPYSVILFDEIEKAHPDVFNLMLQLLDDARLTDSRGLTASFKDTLVIMTTNIGTKNFLNEDISFEEAEKLANEELHQEYRPEFLGRFGGNIYCFNRLSTSVLKKIAIKDIARINQLIAERNVTLEISEDTIDRILEDRYQSSEGARSILGYIDRNITSSIADFILESSDLSGALQVTYDGEIHLENSIKEREKVA